MLPNAVLGSEEMIDEHYKSIFARGEQAFADMIDDTDRLGKFTIAHNNALHLDDLGLLMAMRPEAQMFKLARIEYQHSMYAAAFAQYRQAHISLRLFFELSLCSILFSAHEIYTRQWLKGQKDTNWSAITCKESGIFSKSFIGAFFAEMSESGAEYGGLASILYRECSEFVHGNRKSYCGIDGALGFNPDILDGWLDKVDTAKLVVTFAFFCRFLRDASRDNLDKLEQFALDSFGTMPPIQSIFDKVPE